MPAVGCLLLLNFRVTLAELAFLTSVWDTCFVIPLPRAD